MRQMITVLAVFSGCAPEYELAGVDDPAALVPSGGRAGRQSVTADAPRVHAPKTIDTVMGGGVAASTVDYLFVVDGSSSMESVIDRVFDGVDAIAAEGGVFPAEARIAVMSTTPSDPLDLRRPHPAAPKMQWIRLEPGFHGPVDAGRIARFRALAPDDVAAEFALDGCDGWFAPGEANAQGVPCLVAHTQSLLFPLRVEAGLTALGQRLSEDEPLFRNGAAVNVIFVSDTHDPGLPEHAASYDELVALRPTFEALSLFADAHHNLASFRLHAIAPASECSGERWTDPVYFDAARASGGATLDICTAEPADYVSMIRGMVVSGAVPQRGVVPLAERAEEVEVLVDGLPVAARLSKDGRAVVLDRLPSARSAVTVRYHAAAPRRPLPAR
jgi:hypothetical protein